MTGVGRLRGRCGSGRSRLALLLSAACFLLGTPPADAQLPGFGAPAEDAPPAGVRRFGLFETTRVEFEGLPLFEIAAPLVADRDQPDGVVPVEVRADQVENHLAKLREALVAADTGRSEGDPTALESGALTIDIREQNGQVSLVARGRGLTSPRNLVTVTPIDAEWQQTPRAELAAEWRESIRTALSVGVRARRPDAVRQRLTVVRNVVVGVSLLQLALFGLNWLLLRRQNVLRAEIDRRRAVQSGGSAPGDGPGSGGAREMVAEQRRLLGQSLSLESRFRLLAFLRWLLLWVGAALWVAAGALVLWLFPQTRKVALYLMATPLLALVALFAAGLVNRVTDLAVDRALASWQANRLMDDAHAAARAAARTSTLSGVIRDLKFVLVYAVALVWILSQLEVVHWSILTLGAIAALTLSFALQSLLKDVVMGVLILVEDQYTIGDCVSLLDVTGTVDYMNLRITRVRAADGSLVTVPNGAITKVANFSRNRSAAPASSDVPPAAGTRSGGRSSTGPRGRGGASRLRRGRSA